MGTQPGGVEVDELRMESWLRGWCAGAGHAFRATTVDLVPRRDPPETPGAGRG